MVEWLFFVENVTLAFSKTLSAELAHGTTDPVPYQRIAAQKPGKRSWFCVRRLRSSGARCSDHG